MELGTAAEARALLVAGYRLWRLRRYQRRKTAVPAAVIAAPAVQPVFVEREAPPPQVLLRPVFHTLPVDRIQPPRDWKERFAQALTGQQADDYKPLPMSERKRWSDMR
jgi:hypothetical protein